MSEVMEKEIKHWTARRKAARVLEIIPGTAAVAAARRQFDLTPAEIESRVEDGKAEDPRREKAGVPAGKGRELMLSVQQGLKDEGVALPMTKLCQWFGVARWTRYYTSTRSPGAEDDGPGRGQCRCIGRMT